MTTTQDPADYRHSLARVREVAQELLPTFEPHCQRLMIAGSVRRRRPLVKELEIVYVPNVDREGMYGQYEVDALAQHLEGRFRAEDRIKWGPHYKQAWVGGDQTPYLKLDLFRAEPETFGLILALRTGPGAFSRGLVTPKPRGGYLREGHKVDNGRLWREVNWQDERDLAHLEDPETRGRLWCRIDGVTHVFHPTPEEADFFAVTSLNTPPEPINRHAGL